MLGIEIPPDLTVDDLETLPDTGHRYELHEGNLYIMSPATMWHSRVGLRIAHALRSSGKAAYQEVGIKFGPRNSRTADIAVFTDAPDENRAFFAPSEIAIVIEIVSPSSEDDDRFEKPRLYSGAGIPEYWRVERSKDSDEAIVVMHKLAQTSDGKAGYIETGMTTLGELERSV